jgi:hypothetical protein
MRTVQEIMKEVVSNYQDINGLMKAQFELAQISYELAEDYSSRRKKTKMLERDIAIKLNNDFINYKNEYDPDTGKRLTVTEAREMAKNNASQKDEIEMIKNECIYKGNDVEIRQINKFLSAINQQVSNLKQERQQTNYQPNAN